MAVTTLSAPFTPDLAAVPGIPAVACRTLARPALAQALPAQALPTLAPPAAVPEARPARAILSLATRAVDRGARQALAPAVRLALALPVLLMRRPMAKILLALSPLLGELTFIWNVVVLS